VGASPALLRKEATMPWYEAVAGIVFLALVFVLMSKPPTK
jgi:hypothetical protein